jgi:hypothetical protein
MEFPIGKFAGGADTMVKTIDSRWCLKPWIHLFTQVFGFASNKLPGVEFCPFSISAGFKCCVEN